MRGKSPGRTLLGQIIRGRWNFARHARRSCQFRGTRRSSCCWANVFPLRAWLASVDRKSIAALRPAVFSSNTLESLIFRSSVRHSAERCRVAGDGFPGIAPADDVLGHAEALVAGTRQTIMMQAEAIGPQVSSKRSLASIVVGKG